ncbi:MAG: sulfite exporter TauE/SafE family protein [Clostridia bacterium]|nr:sulfite exporter TauE/SafE family protein [Clostridia bacterium]
MNKNGFLSMIKKIIIGLLAGIVSGLFSTGGGMILVPAFIYLLDVEDTKARGSSVFCILPMVITSSFFYYKGNFIDWKIAFLCALGGAIGGYIGAKLLKKLPEKVMKIAFTIFLTYVSYKMIFN